MILIKDPRVVAASRALETAIIGGALTAAGDALNIITQGLLSILHGGSFTAVNWGGALNVAEIGFAFSIATAATNFLTALKGAIGNPTVPATTATVTAAIESPTAAPVTAATANNVATSALVFKAPPDQKGT